MQNVSHAAQNFLRQSFRGAKPATGGRSDEESALKMTDKPCRIRLPDLSFRAQREIPLRSFAWLRGNLMTHCFFVGEADTMLTRLPPAGNALRCSAASSGLRSMNLLLLISGQSRSLPSFHVSVTAGRRAICFFSSNLCSGRFIRALAVRGHNWRSFGRHSSGW